MNDADRLWLIDEIVRLHFRLINGCGNRGCKIKKPEGMATNGPCYCHQRTWARELRDMADLLDKNNFS